MPSSGLPDLIALAYESACDPRGLQDFVAETARYFRADAATVVVWPRRDPESVLAVTVGLDDEDVAGWLARADKPGTLFHRLQAEPHLQPFGAAVPSSSRADWREGTVLAVALDSDEHNVCALILIRARQGVFSQADHDSLEALAGYMHRAIRINHRFIRLFAEHRAARRLLDTAPRGILVLGQRGQATYINHEARRICAGGDGVRLDNDQLQLGDDEAMADLQAFLAQARASGSDDAPPSSIGLRISRPSEAPPYQLIAYELACDSRQAALDEKEGLAVAMLHDPTVAAVPDQGLLNTYFGLTPAESQLVRSLCAGHSLPAAAQQASISVNTARTHLRSVFQKVGVHSQPALVQRVAQSLRFDAPLEEAQP